MLALLAVLAILGERVISIALGWFKGEFSILDAPSIASQIIISISALALAYKAGYNLRFIGAFLIAGAAFLAQYAYLTTKVQSLKDVFYVAFFYTVCLFFTLVRKD